MSYNVGMYLRLSEDDGEANKFESDSISAQREMIKNYISNSMDLCESKIFEFCDDGYSGFDFKRPSVQKLFDEIRKGNINCVIVKDLSRFGRNHIEMGDYLEQIFPVLNIRFIAINDGYDSINNIGVAGTEIAFKNLMNENYSRDLSSKIQAVVRLNQSKGYYVGSYAPFGYKNVNKKLVVDEEAAKVIKRIFQMADEGLRYVDIARTLNKEGVFTRKEYYYNKKLGYLWIAQEVSKILHNEVYIGTLVSCKTRNYTPNKQTVTDESEQMIFENSHEAIISKELFERVNKVIPGTKGKKKNTYDKELHRKVICGGCGRTLVKQYPKDNKIKGTFTCKHKITDICESQRTDIMTLKKVILKALNVYINLALKRLERYEKRIESKKDNTEEKIKAIDEEIEKSERKKLILYNEYKDEIISKEEFLSERGSLSDKIEKLSEEKEALQKKGCASENSVETDKLIKEYKSKTLTNEMLIDKYLKRVTIYSPDRIEIEWNFKDIFTFK